jgi:hypothetical protein
MKIHQDIKRGPIIAPAPVRLRANLPGVSDHAQIRAAERLPRRLKRSDWLQLVLDILDRRAALLHVRMAGMERRETWLCLVADAPMRVIWAPETAMVLTLIAPRERSLSHTLRHDDAKASGPTKPQPRRQGRMDHDWAEAP